ncbi:hypothetical protein APE_0125.1 [Aeropyrum pernix K1]|uniref:Protein-glutamine gamma-glutamyltransferase-like C-terminal domain-containing protein n=1 Tax=Aeropyrum pernix (strain ATCC 700893 / DSM 11879 / JCM 9820 / NBRC 100138 / K1) TaxID=272557 RepID=Q9YFX5_AERPE|nr:DUF4129 domain-containing protein [Aeropyrum pernix]BAA79036.2 hypothetical protein APE_0125.1 [Aeropyrum pernix K1]
MNRGRRTTVAYPLLLSLLILLSIVCQAAHAQEPTLRHPPELKDPITSLLNSGLIPTLSYSDYAMLAKQLSEVMSNAIAEALQGSLVSDNDLDAVVAMLGASEALSRMPEEYTPRAEAVVEEAKRAVEGLEVFLLAYGLDEDEPYASKTIAVGLLDSGGEPRIVVMGPASHVLLTLVNAVIIDRDVVVLFPVSSQVVIMSAQSGGLPSGVEIGPGRPGIEDKIRDEFLPEEVKESYSRGVSGQTVNGEYQDSENEGGEDKIVDISSLLKELASRLTKQGGQGSGDTGSYLPSGGAVGSGTAAIVASPIGKLGITYEDFARIADILRLDLPEAQAEGDLEGGEVLVPVSPLERAGSSMGLVLTAVAVLGVITLTASYAPEIRRTLSARLAMSRGSAAASAAEVCYRAALEVLETQGLRRMPWETPREFLVRAEKSLVDEQVYAMRYITWLYELHRYGGLKPSPGEAEECMRMVEALRARGRDGDR